MQGRCCISEEPKMFVRQRRVVVGRIPCGTDGEEKGK